MILQLKQSVQQAVELAFHSNKIWVLFLMLLLISHKSFADPCISPFPSVKQVQHLHLPPLWIILKDAEKIVLQPSMIFFHTIFA